MNLHLFCSVVVSISQCKVYLTGRVSCMRQGMFTLSGAPCKTSNLDNYICLSIFIIWEFLLDNEREF